MRISYIFCLITLTLFSCKKVSVHPDKLVLPEITSSGKNTFGSIVNGKVWTANGMSSCWNCGPNPSARLDPMYSSNKKTYALYIEARNAYKNVIDQDLSFSLVLNDHFEVGKKIDFSNKGVFNTLIFRDEHASCIIESDSLTEGFIRIDKLEDGIVSGIFEANLLGSCDTLMIKDGRFDIKF